MLQIAKENSVMDITELSKFLHHYGFVPVVYTHREIQSVYNAHATSKPLSGLTATEFNCCVKESLAIAHANGTKSELLPQPIIALDKLLTGSRGR